MSIFFLDVEAQCQRCGATMQRNDVAVTGLFTLYQQSLGVLHPACAVDLAPRTVHTELEYFTNDFPARTEIAQRASERSQLLATLEKAYYGKRSRATLTIPTADIEQARDPQGRPRHTVRINGAGWGSLEYSFMAIAPHRSISAPTREYALVNSGGSRDWELPWEPTIGAVLVGSCKVRVTRQLLPTLVRWRAANLPSPLLWIPDAESPSAADKTITALRKLLDEAGYSGNDSREITTPKITREALAELGCLLDECFVATRPTDVIEDTRVLAAQLLHEVVDGRRFDAYEGALKQIKKHVRNMNAELRQSIASSVALCMEHPPARLLALEVYDSLTATKAIDAVRDALSSALEEPTRGVPEDAERAFALLAHWHDEERWKLLSLALFAEKSDTLRRKALLRYYVSCTELSVAEQLEAWTATLSKRDKRVASTLEVATQIRKRAEELTAKRKKRKQ